MRIRTTTMAAGLAAAGLVLASVPAQAAVSDAELIAARGAMLTKAEAAKVGVQATASAFTVFETSSKAAKAADDHHIWLCDDPNGNDVAVPGTSVVITMARTANRGEGVRSVAQNVYRYPSAKAAKAAYSRLKTEAKRCTGSSKDDYNGTALTQAVSNGTSTVEDGDEVVWVLAVSDMTGGPQAWASHDYNAFHLEGDTIVDIDVDLDGPGVAPITAAQRKAADELACDLVHRA